VGNGRYFPNASMISLTRATPVRAIVVFVDALDLAEIRFEGGAGGNRDSQARWVAATWCGTNDVAHPRNMNTDLQLDSKLVKCGVNLRMKQ
jgi:hypothetical protein